MSYFGVPELHYVMAPTPTWEKVLALREFLADCKGRGCRFAFTPPPAGQLVHALQVLAYAPAGEPLAQLRLLLPDEPDLNAEQVAALVGVWRAADVREV